MVYRRSHPLQTHDLNPRVLDHALQHQDLGVAVVYIEADQYRPSNDQEFYTNELIVEPWQSYQLTHPYDVEYLLPNVLGHMEYGVRQRFHRKNHLYQARFHGCDVGNLLIAHLG